MRKGGKSERECGSVVADDHEMLATAHAGVREAAGQLREHLPRGAHYLGVLNLEEGEGGRYGYYGRYSYYGDGND